MEFRKSSTISKKLANGRSFNDKSAYDGVFAAPSKRGTPVFSAGLEDYREIFGGTRSSSIPILDFSALQEKKPSIDVRNSKLEYSKVFGTLEELDFSVPYEELQGEPKKADTSSEKPLSTAGRVSPPVRKGSSMDLDKDEVFSHEYQSLDATKTFNMAYNKVNQGSNRSTKGITHVVQLQATSGYTCIFNEFSPLQSSEGEKPASKADDDIRNRVKAVGSTRDTKDHPPASLERQTSRANGFQNKDDWYGKHSLKMKFDSCNLDRGSCSAEPTIFSRSAQFGKNLTYSETSMASKSEVCDACEKAGTVCSPPCFEEEVDVNSVAAASIAALRKAIADAQAKIKIAKELMERRKGGLHGRKMSFADKLNGEERREGGNSYTAGRSKDEKSQETCGKPEAMVNASSEISNQNLRELPEVASVETRSKNISSGRAHCQPEESELLGNEQFYELDRAGIKSFENAYHDETITKSLHNYDQMQNRMTKKNIDNPEEFSASLHGVEEASGKEYGEEKIHVVKEKGFCKELKLAREIHFQEDDENIATTIQKLDETGQRVRISCEKEKCGRREKVNQQKLVEDKKLETQALEENTVKKEIKADECVEFKIIFKQNENETVEKVQMSYEKKNWGKGIGEHLEGPESLPGDKNLETKKLDENSVIRQIMARDWVEYLKIKMGFKQDKDVIGEKVQMSYEKENCQERLGEPPEGKESVQEGQKLGTKELEELTVKQLVKGHEWIEDEKFKMVYGQDKNEIRRKDFVCGEDSDKKPAQVDEFGRLKDCINDFRIGGETKLEENCESRGNTKHQKFGEDEEMIADLSNQIEENGKICEPFEGKRIDLKFDKIAETEIKITQDGLNFWESRLEVTKDLCNWNLSDNLNKNGGANEILDHGKVVGGTSNHPLSEDSKNNFDHPLCEDSKNNFDHPLWEDSRNKMEVVKTSVETGRIEKDSEECMQVNEVEENSSLKTPFLVEDTFILESEMESSNEVEELTQTFSSDSHKIGFGITDVEFGQKKYKTDVEEHKNDFTTEIRAEEFASKVEEVHSKVEEVHEFFVMEDEVLGSLQKEGNNVLSNDDKGLQSNINDLNECYPLRMSEEKGKFTVAAEETITSQCTTTIGVHQASETVEECCTNYIFDVHNSGEAPQCEICENKKIQITTIDDENNPVTLPAEDKEMSDIMNHRNNRMASDSPPLAEEDKFIKKTLETNQNVRVKEDMHQTTQKLEDMRMNDALQNEGRLESEENNQEYAHTNSMNEGIEKCFEIDEEIETLEDMGMNDALQNEGRLESEVNNQEYVHTNSMNEGMEKCFEIDEEIKTLEDMGMNDALQNEGGLESEVNNQEYLHTNSMNEGMEKCFEIDELIETEKRNVEGEQKQQIVPPKKVTETNHEFENPAEVENGHQIKNDEAKESEKEKEQGDVGNEGKEQIVPPKEGTQTNHKSERLLEVEKEHQRKIDEAKEREKENKQSDLENEQNQQIIPPKEGTQTKHEIERLAETEKEDQRKTDEVKEREKEKELERISVERAISEARERAFSEARERVVAERASAQTRLKEKTTAREQPGKTSTESNNKLGAEKASIEAKLRAERNAVERATAEARERALEKAMSKKAFSEAKNLTEKIVEEKLSNAASDGERRRDFPYNYNDTSASTSSRNTIFSNVGVPDSENSNGSIGETAQRHKAKLEKHQRIDERVAKALAEKSFRDRRALQEQAERNRLAESLDADVKRWSSGKEGNLRLLLSTLQYILGPDSGWQPIPLTDILATSAVKKAYRKATLWVHPDKLQQRGASIQQKYVCEKVFDLLQAARNRFNTEER